MFKKRPWSLNSPAQNWSARIPAKERPFWPAVNFNKIKKFQNLKVTKDWIWRSSRFTESDESHGSFLQCENSVCDIVITQTPYLTSITNMRRKNSVIDINQHFLWHIVTKLRKSSISPLQFFSNNWNVDFPIQMFI